MKNENNIPELLAPAGSAETLTAAIQAGADAVYLGAGKFSARANAQNFHGSALAEAIAHARGHGVAVHLAVNTLVTDREMGEVCELVGRALEWGAAAFIVQDAGLARRIRQDFPAAVLHASTQMTARTPDDVQMLARMGFSRVVIARELSQEELRAISAQPCGSGADGAMPIELEVFVHGALCVSYSGQCLMSCFLGGRSANRGRCAQPCRLPYKSAPAQPPARVKGSPSPLLSLKDLCLIDHVGELSEMGIAALKIEGRMKGTDYVRTVVGVYRRALDGEIISPQEKAKLLEVFNRGGYTDGYFTARHGDMYMKTLKNPYNYRHAKR